VKLIICGECASLQLLRTRKVVRCDCGASQAVYLDDRNAIYSGPCVPLGIDNQELAEVLLGQRTQFSGFRIAANSRYFRRVDDALVASRSVPAPQRPTVNRTFSPQRSR